MGTIKKREGYRFQAGLRTPLKCKWDVNPMALAIHHCCGGNLK